MTDIYLPKGNVLIVDGKVCTNAAECCCGTSGPAPGFLEGVVCENCPEHGTPAQILGTFSGVTACACAYVGPDMVDGWITITSMSLAAATLGNAGAPYGCWFGGSVTDALVRELHENDTCSDLRYGPNSKSVTIDLVIGATTIAMKAYTDTAPYGDAVGLLFVAEWSKGANCNGPWGPISNQLTSGDCGTLFTLPAILGGGSHRAVGYGGTFTGEVVVP